MLPIINFLAFLLLVCNVKCQYSNSCNRFNPFQILVFDAGSTKTKLHFFQFSHLHKAFYDMSIDFGADLGKTSALSSWEHKSYAQLADLTGEIATKLLETAQKPEINKQCIGSIGPYLAATAGLRAVNQYDQEKILNAVQTAIRVSAFKDVRARIISGQEEGFYLWMAINFLTHTVYLNTPQLKPIVLDLGGGSTQVAFAISEQVMQNMGEKERQDVMDTTVMGQRNLIYSKSYMNKGLMAVRRQLFSPGHTSECMHFNSTVNFKFGAEKIVVRGRKTDDEKRFDECFNKIMDLIHDVEIVWKGDVKAMYSQSPRLKIFANSAFFYTVRTAIKLSGIQCEDDAGKGFYCSGMKLYEMARTVCENPPQSDDMFKAFICIDINYVFILFNYGYRFPSNLLIKFTNEWSNHDLGWPLGFALNEAHKHFH